MKNSWKRVTAGVLALAMVAGTVPANVEWGDFFGKGAIVAQAIDNVWTAELAQDNKIHYESTFNFSNNTATFTPSAIHFRSEGTESYETGRPAGKCWVGAKLTAPEGVEHIKYNGAIAEDGTEDGKTFIYVWTGFTAEEAVTAIESDNGIITRTYDFKGVKTGENDQDYTYTVNIDVNNTELLGVDNDDTVIFKSVNGEIKTDPNTNYGFGGFTFTNSSFYYALLGDGDQKINTIKKIDAFVEVTGNLNWGQIQVAKNNTNAVINSFNSLKKGIHKYTWSTDTESTSNSSPGTYAQVLMREGSEQGDTAIGQLLAYRITYEDGTYDTYGGDFDSITPYELDVPTDLTAIAGQKLSEIALPTAENGTWEWVNGETTDITATPDGSSSYTFNAPATFTPNDAGLKPISNVQVPIKVQVQSDESDHVGFNTHSSGKYAYGVDTYNYTYKGSLNIYGKTSDSDKNIIKTTYEHNGYEFNIAVSDDGVKYNEYKDAFAEGGLTLGQKKTFDDVDVIITAAIVNDGKNVIINYDVINNSGKKKYIKIGSSADTQLTTNDDYGDKVFIAKTASGLVMSFNFTDENKKLRNDISFSDMNSSDDSVKFGTWVGHFGKRDEKCFNTGGSLTSDTDSGAAWHWEYALENGAKKQTSAVTRAVEADYIVKFNTGYDDAKINDLCVVKNEKAVKPNEMYRAGYTIEGWYLDEQLTEEFDFDTIFTDEIVTGDNKTLTLYAKWAPSYTAPTPKNPTIYSSPVELINAGTVKRGKMSYALGTATEAPAAGSADWKENASDITADSAGTYYVWYMIMDNDQLVLAPKCLTVKVTQAQLWTIEMPDYVYDGTAHEPTINGTAYGDLTYTYLTSAGVMLSEAPTEPGDYLIWVSAAGDETHPSKLESAYYTIKSAKFAAGNTVSFKEKVEFNFLVEATDADTVEGAYVVFTYDHYGEKMTVKKPINKDDKNGKYYRVRLPLTASEMAIDIKAELYLPTLDKPVDTKTRSIKDYAESAIKSNLDGAEVLKAMLNYGGYTQTALGNNTTLLANSGEGIAVDVSSVAPKSATSFVRPVSAQGAKVTYKGSTAMTTSDLYVRHYFTVDSSMTASELNAVMVKVGDNAPISMSKLKKNNIGYYCEMSPELAYELDRENGSVVVYGFAGAETADSENAISIENYNVIDYCEAVAGSNKQTTDAKNMAKAMYSYYTAAKAYVDSRA